MYDFDIMPLRDPARKLLDSKSEDWAFRKIYIKDDGVMDDSFIDSLMYEIVNLADDEKTWKRYARRGFPVMVVFHAKPDHKYPNAVTLSQMVFLNDSFLDKSEIEILKYLRGDCKKSDVVIEKIYKKPEDFVI